MNELDAILESFDYDLWANKRWLEPAEYAGLILILGHIVWAQETWLSRCQGSPARVIEDVHPDLDHLTRSVTAWKDFLQSTPLDTRIDYKSLNGQPFSDDLHTIVKHVLNHGTYHRGDMRGRCEMLGKPFPETDFIAFTRQRDLKP